jgi:hypothetical protein
MTNPLSDKMTLNKQWNYAKFSPRKTDEHLRLIKAYLSLFRKCEEKQKTFFEMKNVNVSCDAKNEANLYLVKILIELLFILKNSK